MAAKILCVGAGGIGCELLKTLVLTGFRNIEVVRQLMLRPCFAPCSPCGHAICSHLVQLAMCHLLQPCRMRMQLCQQLCRRFVVAKTTNSFPMQIDLDTIETSNLNRQFLFRKRHVGQSKAAVAAETVRRFAPLANITAHRVSRFETCRSVLKASPALSDRAAPRWPKR